MMRLCILVADAARARLYTYEQTLEPDVPRDELKEVVDLIDEARRQRPSELFSDNSGANHAGGRGYAFDDHRNGHIAQLDTRFAELIASHATRIAKDGAHRRLLLVASSRMLPALRSALAPLRRTLEITELERDLTKFSTAQLRDHLADLGLLPARPRLAFADR